MADPFIKPGFLVYLLTTRLSVFLKDNGNVSIISLQSLEIAASDMIQGSLINIFFLNFLILIFLKLNRFSTVYFIRCKYVAFSHMKSFVSTVTITKPDNRAFHKHTQNWQYWHQRLSYAKARKNWLQNVTCSEDWTGNLWGFSLILCFLS